MARTKGSKDILPRLPPSDEARKRMSEAQRGVPKSAEHRKAISEGLRGRVVSEETRRKLSEARKRKPKVGTPEFLEDCKRAARARWKERHARRIAQWKDDMLTALALREMELYEDVRKSAGQNGRRKVFHPAVSDGCWMKHPSNPTLWYTKRGEPHPYKPVDKKKTKASSEARKC